jgi:hypothetical protein
MAHGFMYLVAILEPANRKVLAVQLADCDTHSSADKHEPLWDGFAIK